MQNPSQARFIAATDAGRRVCAAAARISTQEGTALDIFERSRDDERGLKLIKKVLSSGHKSLLEHHVFSVAFENVSALAEQFLIEFRLASFIVKSRRYVNFEGAGFHIPDGLTAGARAAYVENMRALFGDYAELVRLGIPKEDARFVLPYCFFSNFYVTVNARELVHMICAMRYGRGQAYPELRALGGQLEAQFETVYPGVVASEKARYERCAAEPLSAEFARPHAVQPSVRLLSTPMNDDALLEAALSFTNRFPDENLSRAMRQLRADARPRELECLNYTYLVENASLPCVTHYARHRIQSPLIPPTVKALNGGGYIVPPSIEGSGLGCEIYVRALERNHAAAQTLVGQGLIAPRDGAYFALSGGATNLMITMNARELLHFMKLRTCARAQWEIRALSASLLEQLRAHAPAVFAHFGPSCAVDGACPEGRMSCGQPQRLPGDRE